MKLIPAQSNPDIKPEPFILGNQYRTQGGRLVRLIGVANEGTDYETMYDELGHHRYTRRDFGRLTGSEWSDDCVMPLYTRPTAEQASSIKILQSAYSTVVSELRNIVSHPDFASLGIVPAAFQVKKKELPPYIYGREAAPNEKVWTEQAVLKLLEDRNEF